MTGEEQRKVSVFTTEKTYWTGTGHNKEIIFLLQSSEFKKEKKRVRERKKESKRNQKGRREGWKEGGKKGREKI